MGQKVNPHGARVGVIFNWSTRWYAGKKDFANNLVEDYKLREMLKKKYYATGISHIDIERSANRVTINIFTAKPGMIIGRGGAGIEALKKDIEAFLGRPANINIMEIKVPDTNAQLVAENIAQQLEKRISFRRAMKQSLQRAIARRRQGHEDHRERPSGRRGYRPHRALSRGLHPPANASRRHRLRLRRSQDHLWPLGRQSLGVQGTASSQAQESAGRRQNRRRQISYVDA